ncbi:outer membrane lipoprotein chaperone LolA [Rhodocyclus tenuis]|uniref:Outer-membrane lipoprotein carrier protein n=2 Tax=Rhodocyclus gracilis TaxID=2929842 RepID=A0ABX0WH33_9RHOO|nr:outer membrane lipoprotein chaperone LolA [Rhodocyclus gracilis]
MKQGRKWLFALSLAGSLSLASAAAQAAAIEKLQRFLESTQTMRADFSQQLVSRDARTRQQSSGVMMLSRPGKFRWQIDRPYQQLLVGDGERVWIHDPELRQVTVKRVGDAMGSTPAALLAGDRALEKRFILTEAGEADGLDWLEATPRAADSGFERVRIGFAGNDLRAMQLFDNFGQTTTLRFSHFERNPALAPALFRFTAPAGTDVIGE